MDRARLRTNVEEPLEIPETPPRAPWVDSLLVVGELLVFTLVYLMLAGIAALVITFGDIDASLSGYQMLAVQIASILLTIPLVGIFLKFRGEAFAGIGLALESTWSRLILVGTCLGLLVKLASIPIAVISAFFGADSELPAVEADSNFQKLALFCAVPLAGIHEEIVFRGYLRKRVARLIHDPNPEGSVLRTGLMTSLLFGVLHADQGLAGIITVTFVGLCFFVIATFRPFNLVHAMIAHAAFNAVAAVFLIALL